MRIDLPRLIITFCLFLSFVRGTNIGLFYPPDEFQLGNIDYIYQTLMNYTLLVSIAGYFLLTNNYNFFRDKFRNATWILAVGLALLSLALSVNKMESLKFVIAVTVISLPSLIYLKQYGAEALLKALSLFAVVMAFLNIAYVLAFPEYGIMVANHDGRWRGLFEHKNTSGPFFAVSFFVILYHLKSRLTPMLLVQLVAMGISLLMVVKAQSSTALVAFGGLTFFYPLTLFLFRLRAGERIAVLLITMASIIFLWVTLGGYVMDLFFELTGKDATLTGRTGIWKVILDLVSERPLYGFGPGLSERPEFMQRIQGDVGWEAKSTHNSFLDLLVSFGYPLAILIVFLILKIWLTSFADTIRDRKSLRLHAMSASLVFATFMIGMAGASALVSRSIIWIIMVIGLAILADLKLRKGESCAVSIN